MIIVTMRSLTANLLLLTAIVKRAITRKVTCSVELSIWPASVKPLLRTPRLQGFRSSSPMCPSLTFSKNHPHPHHLHHRHCHRDDQQTVHHQVATRQPLAQPAKDPVRSPSAPAT